MAVTAFGQREEIDSLKQKLGEATNDSLRMVYYRSLTDLFADPQPDSALVYAMEGLRISIETESEKRRTQFLTRIGNLLQYKGNFSQALEYHLASLKISEEIRDPVGIGASYNNMAEVYKEQGDPRNALEYYAKAEAIFRKILYDLESSKKKPLPESTIANIHAYKGYIGTILMNVGDMYERLNQLDSALFFEQQAYTSAFTNQDDYLLGAILANLGAIYTKRGQPEVALDHFRRSIPYLEADNDKRFLSITFIGMGEIFEKGNKPDSALIYARRSIAAAREGTFQREIFIAASLLSRLFEKDRNADSAFFYQKLVTAVKDTMFAQEKIRKVEALNFGEKLRQQEIELAKAKAARDRSDKLQYMVISLVIIGVFIVLILMRKRKSKTRVIEYMGVIGLLLFFEFIALFIHPFIGKWTHHKPIYMLLILAGIGAILTPLHHVLTHWIKHKLAQSPVRTPVSSTGKTKTSHTSGASDKKSTRAGKLQSRVLPKLKPRRKR